MGGRKWTKDELEALEDMISTHTVQEIADEFDRPVSSVYYKIREMKATESG